MTADAAIACYKKKLNCSSSKTWIGLKKLVIYISNSELENVVLMIVYHWVRASEPQVFKDSAKLLHSNSLTLMHDRFIGINPIRADEIMNKLYLESMTVEHLLFLQDRHVFCLA